MRNVAIGLLIAFFLHAPAWAQDDTSDRSQRALDAFRTWLADNNTKGTLALVRNGVVVLEEGIGTDPAEPIELASLSKSITGICAVELVTRGDMKFSYTFSDVVGGPLAATFQDLLTHQSGLTQDSTQLAMQAWLDAPKHHKAPSVQKLVEDRLKAGGVPKPGSYVYNNENFALAALMIEAASGQTYEEVCHALAMEPSGVSATPSPRSGAFLPWGGWHMRASDHALWHAHWFGQDKPIAKAPNSLPFATIDQGLFYGPGVTFRMLSPGNTFWHFGALCFSGRLNVGSYAASVFGDWTVVAAWNACVDWPAMGALDNAIWQALEGNPS